MKRKSWPLILLLGMFSACAQPPATQTALPATPTQAPPPGPSLTLLVIEGQTLTAVDQVYEFAREVKPGDTLRVEATVQDSAPGSITIMGKSREYEPGATSVMLLNIPDALSSQDIDILIQREDGSRLVYTLRLTKVGPGFQPAVVADISNGVYAGQLSSIPIGVKSLNGETFDITAVSQVLGLGDRYAGNEYVTSQKLANLAFNESGLSFLADTPGNYRLAVAASNGSTNRDFTMDIPVYWQPGKNPFAIRGVAIDTWGPPDWVDLDNVPNVMDIAAAHGANYIQLVPWWNAEGTINEHKIVPCTVEAGCTTPEDDVVRAWIQYAHSKNMKVLLKPHIIGGTFDRNAVRYDFESWQIKPSNSDQWFEEYTNFILHYARIAEEEGADMFAAGNELNGPQTDVARWTKVISAIKEVYHGPLTYSDVLLWQMWDGQVQFWDQLDYIGIPYYYTGPNTTTPLVADIKAEIQKVQARNLSHAMNTVETPVIATEFGRPNFDGTGRNFTYWTNATLDNQEIVDYFDAAFGSMVDIGPRFNGMFLWKLETVNAPAAIGWDFRNKPLGEEIRFWFSN